MEQDKKVFKRNIILVVIGVCLFVALQNFGIMMKVVVGLIQVVKPFIIGICIAFVLNIIVRGIEEGIFVKLGIGKKLPKKVQRPISILLAIICVILLAFVLMFLIVPEVLRTIEKVLIAIPSYIEEIIVKLDLKPEMFESIEGSTVDFTKNMIQFLTEGSIGLFNTTMTLTSTLFGNAFNMIMSIAFSIYLVFHKECLARESKRAVHAFLPKGADRIIEIGALSNTIFSRFVFGQVTEATILGTLCFLGMMIMGFPYAVMISVVIGITALIPVVGAFLGIGIGAIVLLITNPAQAVGFIIFMIILQQIEGNVIYPRVVGKSIGLPSIWVLLAVLIGGNLFGATGMLLGVPIASVIYSLLKTEINKRVPEK